jgi:hypothetical protein
MYVKCFSSSSSSSFFFHTVDLSCIDLYQDSNNDKPFCFFLKMIELGREDSKESKQLYNIGLVFGTPSSHVVFFFLLFISLNWFWKFLFIVQFARE